MEMDKTCFSIFLLSDFSKTGIKEQIVFSV